MVKKRLPFAGYFRLRAGPNTARRYGGPAVAHGRSSERRRAAVMSYCVEGRGHTASRNAGAGGRMFRRHTLKIELPGGHRSRVTPVPIPNTEVKPATADGTARAGGWESRSLPGIHSKARVSITRAFSLYDYCALRDRPIPGISPKRRVYRAIRYRCRHLSLIHI